MNISDARLDLISCLSFDDVAYFQIYIWDSERKKKNLPLIWTRCRFLKCFTVISRMSAFSNLECLELCVVKKKKGKNDFAFEKRLN